MKVGDNVIVAGGNNELGQPTMIDHPPHYNWLPIECIDVAQYFSYCLGCAIKYIWRAGRKNNTIEDLQKAVWYLNAEIERLKKQEEE